MYEMVPLKIHCYSDPVGNFLNQRQSQRYRPATSSQHTRYTHLLLLMVRLTMDNGKNGVDNAGLYPLVSVMYYLHSSYKDNPLITN